MEKIPSEGKVWTRPQFTKLGAMRDVAKIAGNEGKGGGTGGQGPS